MTFVQSQATYTPTLTLTTNVAAATAYLCQYSRVKNFVTVSGKVDIDPTATGNVELGLSVPIASDFTLEEQAGGTIFSQAVSGLGGAVKADPTANGIVFRYNSSDLANRTFWFTFSYLIV